MVEEQHIAREIGVREIYPLIKSGIGDVGPVQDIFSAGLTTRQSTSIIPVHSKETVAIRNTDELRFLLRATVMWYEASINETRDFQIELEEIQVMLQEEMERLGHGTPVTTLHP